MLTVKQLYAKVQEALPVYKANNSSLNFVIAEYVKTTPVVTPVTYFYHNWDGIVITIHGGTSEWSGIDDATISTLIRVVSSKPDATVLIAGIGGQYRSATTFELRMQPYFDSTPFVPEKQITTADELATYLSTEDTSANDTLIKLVAPYQNITAGICNFYRVGKAWYTFAMLLKKYPVLSDRWFVWLLFDIITPVGCISYRQSFVDDVFLNKLNAFENESTQLKGIARFAAQARDQIDMNHYVFVDYDFDTRVATLRIATGDGLRNLRVCVCVNNDTQKIAAVEVVAEDTEKYLLKAGIALCDAKKYTLEPLVGYPGLFHVRPSNNLVITKVGNKDVLIGYWNKGMETLHPPNEYNQALGRGLGIELLSSYGSCTEVIGKP